MATRRVHRLEDEDARISTPRTGRFENCGVGSSNDMGVYAKRDVPENAVPVIARRFTSISAQVPRVRGTVGSKCSM
jgi:hypothetical protein